MLYQYLLAQILLLVVTTNAALNEPCVGAAGTAGVCVASKTCSDSGGKTSDGGCPNDPADVKCCTKATCTNGATGNCRWASDCTGKNADNQCPGPGSFKCCSEGGSGFGGYKAPVIPSVGACKQKAVTGAKKISEAWPGRVREIGCFRENCDCAKSDHCCGLGTDMMCSDAGGTATLSGQAIAEWVMNHRTDLDLKYVIWGQKIWSPTKDAVGPWSGWRPMEDRKSITQNHWDHVHVSYNS